MFEVSKNTVNFGFDFHIYGSEEDVLAFDSVKKEEAATSEYSNRRIKYYFSKGHHREWLSNQDLFAVALSGAD